MRSLFIHSLDVNRMRRTSIVFWKIRAIEFFEIFTDWGTTVRIILYIIIPFNSDSRSHLSILPISGTKMDLCCNNYNPKNGRFIGMKNFTTYYVRACIAKPSTISASKQFQYFWLYALSVSNRNKRGTQTVDNSFFPPSLWKVKWRRYLYF